MLWIIGIVLKKRIIVCVLGEFSILHVKNNIKSFYERALMQIVFGTFCYIPKLHFP